MDYVTWLRVVWRLKVCVLFKVLGNNNENFHSHVCIHNSLGEIAVFIEVLRRIIDAQRHSNAGCNVTAILK